MALATELYYSVADIAELASTSAAQINTWRYRWSSFPKPSYTNQKGLSPLWSEADKTHALELIDRHLGLKASRQAL